MPQDIRIRLIQVHFFPTALLPRTETFLQNASLANFVFSGALEWMERARHFIKSFFSSTQQQKASLSEQFSLPRKEPMTKEIKTHNTSVSKNVYDVCFLSSEQNKRTRNVFVLQFSVHKWNFTSSCSCFRLSCRGHCQCKAFQLFLFFRKKLAFLLKKAFGRLQV